MKVINASENYEIWSTDKEGVHYFEHKEYGEDGGCGHIWQVDGYIEDYDGVYSLPKEIEDLYLGYM